MSTSGNIPFAGSGRPPHPTAEDLSLFAMQLLPVEEMHAVAEHLASCLECRAELAHIHSELALTAATVQLQSPPEHARERLTKQLAREKKIAFTPAPAAQAEPEPNLPLASFGRNTLVLSMEDQKARSNPGRTIIGVAGWAAAAALAVVAGLQYKDRQNLGETLATQNTLIQRLNAEATNAHQLMDAITDPRAIRVALSSKPLPKSAPVGAVTYNPDKGTLVFLASNLDPLQTYKVYELWIIPANGGPSIPAGTFHPDDQGNASVIMPDVPKGVPAKAFGVTIEAQGGSQQPTPPIIMAGS